MKLVVKQILESDPGPKNIARVYLGDVLALTAFACRMGLVLKSSDRRAGLNSANEFQRLLVEDLVSSGIWKEEKDADQFLAARSEGYDACVRRRIEELGRWDADIAKDIGVVFEQSCRGPAANHDPNLADAGEVVFLRFTGANLFLSTLECVIAAA